MQYRFLMGYIVFIMVCTAYSSDAEALTNSQQLSQLKHDMIQLNSDIMRTRMNLVTAKHQQLTVLLQLDRTQNFALYNIKLRLNDNAIVDFDYSDREIHALKNGGVQRLYFGDISPGRHQITAFLTGTQSDGNIYKRGATLKLIKAGRSKTLLVKIIASGDGENAQLLLADLPL